MRVPPLITDTGVAASPAELGETLKTAFFPLAPPQVEITGLKRSVSKVRSLLAGLHGRLQKRES